MMRVHIKNGVLTESLSSRIPRMAMLYLEVGAFGICDRLPWFARKRIANWLAGWEVLSDFVTTEHLDDTFSNICIRF